MKKLLSLTLALILLIQPVAALSFSDLDQAAWAEDYILQLADKGIVNGYSDGTYKPLDSVSHYAAILVIYRALEAEGLIDSADASVYVNRYQSVLNTYNVPNWPDLDKAIAYCVERDIFDPEVLRGFVTGGSHQPISRQDMALYMGRAWNQFLKEDVNQIIDLNFKDIDQIDLESQKYINILVDHDIISGDDKGNFNPSDSLNRAALAKLIVTGLAALTKTENIVNEEIAASVYVKLDDTRKIVFYKEGSTTESYIEKISDDIDITIDGTKAGYTDLVQDQQVTLVYANDKLIAIKAKPISQTVGEIVGRVTDVVRLTDKRVIYMMNGENNELESYQLAADAVIMQGDQVSSFDAIASGDTVAIRLDGGMVSKISFQLEADSFTGVLKSIEAGAAPKLTVGVASGELRFNSDENTVFKRDGDVVKASDLVVGDQITIVAKRNLAQSVSAQPADANIRGRFVSLRKTVITIDRSSDDKRVSYDVNPQVVVLIDGSQQQLTSLADDDRLALEIVDDKVIKIAVTRREEVVYQVGRVVKLYPEVASVLLAGERDYTVNFPSGVIIVDQAGNRVDFSALQTGQKLFVYGTGDERKIDATKVFILE